MFSANSFSYSSGLGKFKEYEQIIEIEFQNVKYQHLVENLVNLPHTEHHLKSLEFEVRVYLTIANIDRYVTI